LTFPASFFRLCVVSLFPPLEGARFFCGPSPHDHLWPGLKKLRLQCRPPRPIFFPCRIRFPQRPFPNGPFCVETTPAPSFFVSLDNRLSPFFRRPRQDLSMYGKKGCLGADADIVIFPQAREAAGHFLPRRNSQSKARLNLFRPVAWAFSPRAVGRKGQAAF